MSQDQRTVKNLHNPKAKIHQSHEKAAWLKIYDDDDEEKEEKKEDKQRKIVKGVYKRTARDTSHRVKNERAVTSRDIYDGRSAPERPKSASARNADNACFEIEKANQYESGHLDLDFADKIKAFRSLLKKNPTASLQDGQGKSRTGFGDVTAHGGHIKFNSKSVEGRASAPNEFQLTYEQDRYFANARNYPQSSANNERKHYSNVALDENNAIYPSKNDENFEVSQKISPMSRVIKRPSQSDKEQNKVRQIASILKHQRSNQTRNEIYNSQSAQNENTTNNGLETTHSRESKETISSSQSHRNTSPSSVRPASVTELKPEIYNSHSSHRSHSTIPHSRPIGFSGGVHYDVGSMYSSSISSKKDNAMSLQTHLNVLGASLSSLSSIVNGGDSSDNTMEPSDIRRQLESPSSIVSSGRSGRFDYSSRITDAHRQGGRPSNTLNVIERKFSASPSSEISGASLDMSSLPRSVSHFAHKSEINRPRSDDYFMLEKSHQNVPNSPRAKQTNVKGVEDEDSILSPRDVNFRPNSDLGFRRHAKTQDSSELIQNSVSSEKLSKPNLRRYVQYISRHKDNLSDYSSHGKGAKQTNNKSIDSQSFSSSVNEEKMRVSNSREIQTQTPLSDSSDSDTLEKHDSEILSSYRESFVMGLENRPKIISRHKTLTVHSQKNGSEHNKANGDRISHQLDHRVSSQNKSSHSGAHEHQSNASSTKSSVIDKTRIIRRPPSSPSHDSERKNRPHTSSRSSPQSVSGRSQTVLGLSSSKESIKNYAILPSKYNAKNASLRQRPHSALEGNVIGVKSSRESRTVQLMKKVQNLHKEVDERLKSDKNKTHSVTSSLSDLFEKVNNESDNGSEFISKLKASHRQSEDSDRIGTRNKAKIVIRRKKHNGTEIDIESGSERERFSSASEKIISTSTPRKTNPSHRSPSLRRKPNDVFQDDYSSSNPYRHVSTTDSDDVDGCYQLINGKGQNSLADTDINGQNLSPVKARVLSDKLRKILYSSGHSPYTSRYEKETEYRSHKERDSELFDVDKDEDDTLNAESHRREYSRPPSSSLSNGLTESKGRSISPFIKRLAYVDISSQSGRKRHPVDIQKLTSGRASPADVLMGYLDNPNTVRLLQKLYQADPIDREIIMIKVLYFKAWLHFSTTNKQKRLRKRALTECADTFCYQRILALHFIVWERNARYSLNVRRASSLCRRHMLSKGFKALRWSVSHSRHCKELIQTKYRMLTTRTSFDIWKNKTVKQRRERMEKTWQRWNQFVTEVHKIRHMQAVIDKNVTERVYMHWKKCYDKHMKQRMAFNYFRHTLYKHTLHTWSAFVFTCKQKKEKYLSAVCQYQTKLVRTYFFQVVFAFKKSRKARNHFRKQKLNEVFWSWKQASQICRVERQQNLLVSIEHCRVQTMVRGFRQWKQKMMLRRADAHANSHLYRNVFNCWIKSYHEQFTKRLEIETALERKKLHRALLTWRRNVVQIQRRHKKAAILIERCLIRSTITVWRQHVGTKIGMRQKVQRHQREVERTSLKSWFSLWFDKYTERLDDKKRQMLWSQSCARKLFKKWRHICHQRSLERKLEESQPYREFRFLQTMFARWLTSLEKRRGEEQEAEYMRKHLEQRNLQNYLKMWKNATKKQLMIKPLIRQREQRTVEECFKDWWQCIRSNVDCRRSKADFLKIRTRKCFNLWRQQYLAHQVEKRIKSEFSQGLLVCCFDGWKLFIELKKRGHHFRHKRLVAKKFNFWKSAASRQVSKRIMLKEEENNNSLLKRQYFVTWWEHIQREKATVDVYVNKLSLARGRGIVSNAFGEWKRLLHSTLIARSYQKMFNQRLVLTMLLEWRGQVVNDVHSAVSVFQEKIGMVDITEEQHTCRLSSTLKESWHSTKGLDTDFGEHIQEDENIKMSVSGSLSSSFTAGLFTRLLDENSSIDSDTDRSFLLSGGLQDAALSHQAKCNKMKEIATTAIWRLRHWPICLAFQQWQEFTWRQIQLNKAATQVKEVVHNLETRSALRSWRLAFTKMIKSREHRDYHLKYSTLAVLHQNTKHCRHVKLLAKRSERHLNLKVFSQYFPIWLRKTQKQRREKEAVTLWTSSTAEEMELFPLERRLATKLNDRTLKLCFSLWLLKVSHIQKIRHVYHTNTLQWVFNAWHNWASYRQSLVKKSITMTCHRRTKMAFKKWCEKYRQSRQTAVLYQQAWNNYQTHILIVWHQWAKASHRRRTLYISFKNHRSQAKMILCFNTWKMLTSNALSIQNRQRVFHLHNVFREWCQYVQDAKTKRQMTIQFQIRSYTLLVKRLFQHWHGSMVRQRIMQEERTQEAERKAVHYSQVWRRKCQTSRGKQIEKMFQYRKVSAYLQIWQLRYASIQVLHERLGDWEKRRNTKLIKVFLQAWVLTLKGKQMGRDYKGKLLHSIVYEWRVYTKESRDRRTRGLALTKALQERSLHVYFQFWVAITKVKMSVRYNAETRLQIKIMRSWHQYARNKRYLTQLQDHFTHRVNTRILADAFTKLRWRTEYCNHLQEVADKIVQDRVRATLTAVVVLWRQRLDNIIAARCYGGILVVRVVRQWRRFVHKRRTEREKEMADQLKAVHFSHLLICKRAVAAFKELVLVSKVAAKRKQRLCDKYALLWKTRVDLQISAMEMEWDMVCWRTWRRWRREFAQRQSARKIERDNSRHLMSQAFKSWRKLCKPSLEMTFYQTMTPRTERRVSSSTSQLPVPRGRGFYSASSSNRQM